MRAGAGIADQVYQLSRLALAARNGDVAVLQVYMDESGTHDVSVRQSHLDGHGLGLV
jgi:hypothetical protein